MTIRTRFTFIFTGTVSVLLAVLCAIIYFEASQHQQREFRQRLRKEAVTSATLLANKSLISPDLFTQLTKKQITALTDEELVIISNNKEITYESGASLHASIDTAHLLSIEQNGEFFWKSGDRNVYGTKIKLNDKSQTVIMAAYDKYGISQQKNLRYILLIGWLAITLLSLLAGWFLAGRFLFPIKKIIRDIDKITGSKIGLRLPEGKRADELEQLSIRFNQMLNRLESAFNAQKAFVSHASHELRTPLTSVTGQIQVSLMVDKTPQELRQSMQSVLDDIQQLNKLTNNLLDLTSIKNYEQELNYELINVVHLLWQARTELLKKNASYKILMTWDETDDSLPEIYANESLIYTAFINLMDNGAKFGTDNSVEVSLHIQSDFLELIFKNTGAAIPSEEITRIFEPFNRGTNSQNIKGHGVGLSLVKQIIELHKGTLTVTSDNTAGTTFVMELPRTALTT